MATVDTNLIPFGLWANCNLDPCPLEWSVFRYLPSIPANPVFIGVFSALLIAHLIQGIWFKAWGYMVCIVLGCGLELAGYAGRIMLYKNPFDVNAFLINLVPTTVAPVFFCCDIRPVDANVSLSIASPI